MKHKIVNGVLIGCISAFLISCNARKEEPAAVVVDKEQIKKDIQAREDEFAALYNASEMKNIGYYSDDATSFYPNRPPIIGKPAIIDHLKPTKYFHRVTEIKLLKSVILNWWIQPIRLSTPGIT
jgi:hypothetical protein